MHFVHAYIYINTYIHSLILQIRCFTSDENSHSEELQQYWNVVFNKLRQESFVLFSNRNYIVLFIAFSIGVCFFNSLLTLLNQIIAPHGYSNDDAGFFGAVFIGLGLVGAGTEYYSLYVCMHICMYGFFHFSSILYVRSLRRTAFPIRNICSTYISFLVRVWIFISYSSGAGGGGSTGSSNSSCGCSMGC